MSNPISFDNNDSRMGYECNNGSERNNSDYHLIPIMITAMLTAGMKAFFRFRNALGE